MSILEQFLTFGTVLIALYAVATTVLLLQTILKRRDKLYRSKYEDFIQQKNRVIKEIKRSKEDVGY